MTINLHLPSHNDTLKPKITVIGVGGAGGNAVNNMIASNLEGVDFVMANTDAQALDAAMTDRTIQLGVTVTRGLGAGANPSVGQSAAEEAIDDIADHIEGSNMVFITAGMGGGTGTGAAPVIAQLAREQGILTVGVVTKPFHFEGNQRMRLAESGIEELQQYVDTLIIIPNQNLFRIANEKTTFADAFRLADEVLHSGVRGVTDLMVKPGLVNLDFADIRTVMSEMGKAMMGTGEAEGDRRAIDAAESAISNPLLDDVSLGGARGVLINITGGPDMTLFEVDEAANRIRDEVDPEANIIFGSTFSDVMEGKMRVSVVATGIEQGNQGVQQPKLDLTRYTQPKTPEKVAKPSAVKSTPNPAKAQAPAPQRERTPAEIVRDSGNTSAFELARQKQEQAKRAEMATMSPQPELFSEPEDSLSADEPMIETEAEPERKAFKLGAVREQTHNSAGAFAPPQAEMPSQRTHFAAQAEDEEMFDDDDAPQGRSFFQKIAGVGKAMAARVSEEMEEEFEEEAVAASASEPAMRARPVVKEQEQTAPNTREDEEYLDIPAFLRRQAN
jgi:cell division protein FtsZ